VFAEELGVTGALLALLNEAIEPNLVQSEEGVPAFVHGGPFANIAHGCNSVLATRMALGHADFAVTEAGFAFDLGGEKFMHIKCRQSGLAPDAIVVVATVRALKMHGGTDLASLRDADSAAVQRGLDNLAAHLDSAAQFGRPRIVAINKFADDSAEEIQVIEGFCRSRGVACAVADAFAQGGDGCRDLAHVVAATVAGEAPSPLPMLYNPADGTMGAIKTIAQKIYGADGADFTDTAREKLATLEQAGLTGLPVCMAKTQNSLSDNASFMNRPKGFRITVRDFEVANGAGFLVALTGTLVRMPALPKSPAALRINVQADGTITGI
jgi:formate--tetrahydrofolate ligase